MKRREYWPACLAVLYHEACLVSTLLGQQNIGLRMGNTCSVHPTRCASNYVMSLNNVIIIIMFKLEDIHQTNVLAKKKKFCPSHKIYTCTLYASLFTNKQKTPNQKILKCIKKHQKIVGPLKMLTKI